MGLAGGLLTAIRSVAHSRTTDPVTGQRRPVSSTPSSASLSARQDLGQGSWGAMLTGGLESTFYGVRQVTRMRSDPSRSEESRVGTEYGSTLIVRGSADL